MCYGDEPDIKGDIERLIRAVEASETTTEDAAFLRWLLNWDKPKQRSVPNINSPQPPF